MRTRKNIIVVGALMILGVLLISCGTGEISPPPHVNGEHEEISIGDYYPFLENTVLEYEGTGNEYAELTMMLEYVDGRRGQFRTINPGTETIRIIEVNDEEVRETYQEGEFYHTENMLNSRQSKNNILLKGPLTVGNSWDLEDGYVRELTSLESSIDTPYGLLEAIEVTTYYEEGRYQKNYYSRGIGLVGILYYDGDAEITTLLREIKTGPYQKSIKLYHPHEGEDEIVLKYKDYSFGFNTNDNMADVFCRLFREPVEDGLVPLISEDTRINSIVLDRGSWTLRADFSRELVPGWNAGSTLESKLILGIVNTLGEFYDTDRVYLSIDGVPFESGHYQLVEGEDFKVETEGIEEYQK